jgi:phosphoglycerol transferase MdoB-like AlkP superfamily enzyme
MAGIFTLSSHHPYTVPQELKGKFPLGTLPIHESIGYADYSLKMFFQEARKTDWYANTLFVITADHTSLSDIPEFQTKLSSLSIPILFFFPGDSLLRGKSDVVTQQIDIMPSVLSLLGFDKLYFCLGQNAFDTTANHFAVAFKFDQYQMLQNGNLLSFDGENSVGLHDVRVDPIMHSNLFESQPQEVLQQERMLKGYLQNYSKALVQNKMTLEAWQGKTK